MTISPIQPELSVIQEIRDPALAQYGVKLLVKREDLIHPQVSGNKWRKLKYNLEEAQRLGHGTLLTFGGAFSNHILATATAGKLFGFQTIGIIRGEEHLPLNSTLSFAMACGMVLHYVGREEYRNKNSPEFMAKMRQQFGGFYVVPEGGSNAFALKGCGEMISEITRPVDYICVACGTGGTLAGMISGYSGSAEIIGFPVLKGAGFLYADVEKLLLEGSINASANWTLNLDYHFGGYAKKKPELMQFIQSFQQVNDFSIEFVYTGKLFYGVYDLIKKGFFKKGSTVMVIHTGGLRRGMEKFES